MWEFFGKVFDGLVGLLGRRASTPPPQAEPEVIDGHAIRQSQAANAAAHRASRQAQGGGKRLPHVPPQVIALVTVKSQGTEYTLPMALQRSDGFAYVYHYTYAGFPEPATLRLRVSPPGTLRAEVRVGQRTYPAVPATVFEGESYATFPIEPGELLQVRLYV